MSARESQAPGGSAKARARVSKCPICGKPQIEHYRPFCSKHCADIDLGRWLEGRYAVPGEPASPDAAEEDQD